jgi:hypothetical protein
MRPKKKAVLIDAVAAGAAMELPSDCMAVPIVPWRHRIVWRCRWEHGSMEGATIGMPPRRMVRLEVQIQSHQCFCVGADKIGNMENGNSKGREIELLEIARIICDRIARPLV